MSEAEFRRYSEEVTADLAAAGINPGYVWEIMQKRAALLGRRYLLVLHGIASG